MVNIILDVNFWSYLADAGRECDFARLEDEMNTMIILPPSILLEAQKTKDKEKRIRILKAMYRAGRKTLSTEADLEAEEFINEIRRLKPEWRRAGDIRNIKRLRDFWQRKIWQTAISNTDNYHTLARDIDRPVLEGILKEQTINKIAYEKAGWNIQKIIPSKMIGRVLESDRFVSKHYDIEKDIEPWRLNCLHYYRRCLSFKDGIDNPDNRTVLDWCEPWLKINRILDEEKDYVHFWLDEVNATNMKRNWIRWAIRSIQPFKKIGDGNPADQQHTAYLFDADYFFTCDRRFHACLEILNGDPLVNGMASPVLLTPNIDAALETIERAILAKQE